jgi:hypothetical protein
MDRIINNTPYTLMKKSILLVLTICFSYVGISQEYFPKNDGRDISLETHQTKLWKRYMGKYNQK